MELPGRTEVVPVIVSGGSGSRLWPLSREAYPKPFIKMPDGESLLQKTFLRAQGVPNVQEITIVTRQELFFSTKDELEALTRANLRDSVPSNVRHIQASYILEPFARNTAPAIAIAALHLARKFDKKTVLAIFPADHLITDNAAFFNAANSAIELAAQGFIATLGIKPTRPETGYGYIEIAKKCKLTPPNTFKVERFIEKPNKHKAKEYMNSNSHFWNAGMFFFSIETILNEMSRHCRPMLDVMNECYSLSTFNERLNVLKLDAPTFENVEDISIDYALMEKSNNVATVTCDFQWNDIGSWNSLSDLVKRDDAGNQVIGDTITHDTTNCYLHATKRMIGTIGIDNLAIIDTDDALLVANRDRVQDVKQLVQLLKHGNSEIIKYHKQVHRPWGHYTVISESEGYKIKFINVRPGAKLSLQMHYHRSEHWIVVSGTARVINGDKKFIIKTNESTFIPAGHKHRLENPGTIDLVIVEVQCGQYLGEDDIVRFEDSYDRVPEKIE